MPSPARQPRTIRWGRSRKNSPMTTDAIATELLNGISTSRLPPTL